MSQTMTEQQQLTLEAERMSQQIAKELELSPARVLVTMGLLDEGNTIPFIARYRKEMTGEMDENKLRDLEERLQYLRTLQARKQEVVRLIDEQGKLDDTMHQAIMAAEKLQEVEDLYRPYRQKRRTRASVARERGLEPLAAWIRSEPTTGSLQQQAAAFVDPDKELPSVDEAIAGAMDIIAEEVSDDAKIRTWIRRHTFDHGLLESQAKSSNDESVYEMYYAYSEPIRKLPPHRVLAINRGEREEVLKVSLTVQEDKLLVFLERQLIRKQQSVVADILRAVAEDAYKRLISPSIEREVRNELTEQAEEHAISIFALNLRQLLLQPPLRGKVVLGVDPAFRTGCKLAVVDDTGKLLDIAISYPTPPMSKVEEATRIFKQLIEKHAVELIVIGNGTASRETEQFVADLIRSASDKNLKYLIVNEAGASVYSASKLAAEEFPKLDVAERSAVSIARRIQDPLAELVKIDPKAIGVGQYQHDVAQKRLGESLKAVVESAVNHVGVDLNTASPALLSYVSGINATIAKNIVQYREEHGRFSKRDALKKVPRLGAKTFEQCAGFLRILSGDNPLDNTGIHPESYQAVKRLLAEMRVGPDHLGTPELQERLRELDLNQAAENLGIGVPTLVDIIDSLQRPGRDPRDEMPAPVLHTDILKLEDLKPGMKLEGTVRNVIDFGAFVDIGLKNDGLVHISQLSNRFVKHPTDVVAVGDIVTVWVLSVEEKRGRVGLTMRGEP